MDSIVPRIRLNSDVARLGLISERVIVTLLIVLCSLLSNLAKANDIIYVSAESNRYPINLGTDTALQLCDLVIDKEYAITLSDLGAALIQVNNGETIETFNTDKKIYFTPSVACVELQFKELSRATIEGTISLSCEKVAKASSRSQIGIQTDVDYTAAQLIKDIFIGGDCFEVQNIQYTGAAEAMGFFEAGSNSINIEKGVMLSTGEIANAHGPNVSTRISTDFADYTPGDNDLEDLLSSRSVTLEDVVVLEFDFTPTTNFIHFEYAFASEEYCDYVGSKFNDVFGFFLSGPGIDGPFENNAANIAFVPGTSDFVAINNINHLLNEEFFVNNVPEGQVQFVPCDDFPEGKGVATELIEFDGFTTVLSAVADVIPCETYHIKLAIADASDALFDSAVFLKANSFNAGGSAYVRKHLPDRKLEEAYEGCQESYFLFERTDDDLTDSLKVHFKLSDKSTAIAGVDFETLPEFIIIPPGEKEFLLPVEIYTDEIIEGKEVLIMELESACSCADLSINLTINDFVPFAAASQTNSICGEQLVNIAPIFDGGVGDLTYLWNTGDTSSNVEILVQESTNYIVTITDVCNNQVITNTSIEVIEAPSVVLDAETVVCNLSDPVYFDLNLGGLGPWHIDYTLNGVLQSTFTTEDSTTRLPAIEEGLYELQEISNTFCTKVVEGSARLIVAQPESAAIQVEQPICAGETGAIHVLEVRGGSGPYKFSIDGGKHFYDAASFDPVKAAEYSVVIQDSNGCDWVEEITIVEPDIFELILDTRAVVTLGERYELVATTNLTYNKIAAIQWSPSEQVACEDCLVTDVLPLQNTSYELAIMDERGCIESASINITVLKDHKIFVPTAFSPNGDGHNDLFFVNANAAQVREIRQFQVINRWGDLLYKVTNFQPNDPTYAWDGTYNGRSLNAQVFAYFLEIEFIDGDVQIFKGDVTLVEE